MPPRQSIAQKRQTVTKLTPKQIEEQRIRVRQTQACLKVQRVLRGMLIKKAMEKVRKIEDLLFALREQALVVQQEFLELASKPSEPTTEEEDLKLLEASPPDFGLIIPELDTPEEKEERERVQAEYDEKLAAAKEVAEEKRIAREELDSIDAAVAENERITQRAFARELRRREFQGDAERASEGLWAVLAPGEGLILGDLARLRAHKLRRLILEGPCKHLQLVLVRPGEADYMANDFNLEKQRPLSEEGITQAATAGQNIAMNGCNPDILLCSTSQRCLETAQWIQELAPKEWMFSTCKALDQKEDPSGRMGPSILPVADAIIAAAEARGDILSVCLVTYGMLLETIASCLTFQSDDCRDHAPFRLMSGDVVVLKSKPLQVAEGEEMTERPACDLWEEAMRSERWSVVEHMRGAGDPYYHQLTPRQVDPSVSAWYGTKTDMTWVSCTGDPLIYTDDNLVYANRMCGTKEPQARQIVGGIRLLADGWVSPRDRSSWLMQTQRPPEEDEGEDSVSSLNRRQSQGRMSRMQSEDSQGRMSRIQSEADSQEDVEEDY